MYDERESALRTICNTETGPYLRPFAAHSKWQAAKGFIVGTNPATPLRGQFDSFDDYWNSLTCDTDRFEEKYRAEHHGGTTKTTKRTRFLKGLLEPENILIANAIAFPAPKKSSIPRIREQERIGTQILQLLLDICRPRVIFFHGVPAVQAAFRVFDVELDISEPPSDQNNRSVYAGDEMHLFAYPHLSGAGAPKGFKVSGIDFDLRIFAQRISKALKAR